MKVAVIDMGLGNLLSIRRGLERAGAEVIIAQQDVDAEGAVAIVLPGVGAFRDGAKALSARFERTVERARSGEAPLLGICLGMQLLFTRSFEGGEHRGLDLIRGDVVRLPGSVKVPHMGWNSIRIRRGGRLTKGLADGDYFYFVHSYYCGPEEDVTVAEAEYGVQIPAIVEKGWIFGVQFHPEKSGAAGQAVIRNFLEAAKEWA